MATNLSPIGAEQGKGRVAGWWRGLMFFAPCMWRRWAGGDVCPQVGCGHDAGLAGFHTVQIDRGDLLPPGVADAERDGPREWLLRYALWWMSP